jgi:hypothetical protein
MNIDRMQANKLMLGQQQNLMQKSHRLPIYVNGYMQPAYTSSNDTLLTAYMLRTSWQLGWPFYGQL